ncbi:MAG TPA: Na+/H+ antiporter NhaA [Myxococcota bacterium]|nr:Na+/H+ antiporter NhaA [Myxococcota bacterium]
MQRFFAHEAAGGALLFMTALLAMVAANSDLSALYAQLVHATITLGVGTNALRFDIATFVNDGLMTVFFFVVGMEVKRELVSGELRTMQRALLPAVAAAGGMAVPAGIYAFLNAGTPAAVGWGVPVATDIAFVIGCLSLLGKRVPQGLAVFVVALAIFDDIGGILVIALRYGNGLHFPALVAAGGIVVVLVLLNRLRVVHWAAYAACGVGLWLALHHGGVHATLAGVVLGLAVPANARRSAADVLRELREYLKALPCESDAELKGGEIAHIEDRLEDMQSPLERFVEALHPLQVYFIMPFFAFVNAGVDIRGMSFADLATPVPLGVALGLIVGKQVGVFGATFIAVKARLAPMPTGGTWWGLYGVSVLAGIGFTVALFIADLAFADVPQHLSLAKVGILVGSLVSGLIGFAVLRLQRPAASA